MKSLFSFTTATAVALALALAGCISNDGVANNPPAYVESQLTQGPLPPASTVSDDVLPEDVGGPE